MRARVAFDTLAYANRLKAAGVEPKVAEAQAEINADMVAALLDGDLATKSDVLQLKSDLLQLESKLERQIQESRSELERQIQESRSELGRQIQESHSELEERIQQTRTDIVSTKSELKQDIKDLEKGMKDLENRLTLRLGGIMLGGLTAFSIILSLLHEIH